MKLAGNKRTVIAALIFSLIMVCAYSITAARNAKKERLSLENRRTEFIDSREKYIALKAAVASVEGRKSLVKVEGIVQAVDEVFRPLGLSRKVRSVKPTGSRDIGYGTEEEADVQVEKVNMNELLNILYRTENAPMFLSVRKTSIKTSFDNPQLLNLSMTVLLIRPK